MWPWRRHAPANGSSTNDVDLPHTCFFSRAFDDDKEQDRINALLPSGVKLRVFPRITLPPDELVSNELISEILDCPGLIYVRGGASDTSFWVAFERDYALRAGKRVYSFDRDTGILAPDTSPPLSLNVFASYADVDATRRHVESILRYMERERYFSVTEVPVRSGPRLALDAWPAAYEPTLGQGGCVIVFWDQYSSDPVLDAGVAAGAGERFGVHLPVIFALLDKVALDEADQLKHLPPMQVQLFGDGQRSETQRIDDLIVRLYWSIFQNTRQNQLS